MKLLRTLIHTYLAVPYGFHRLTGTGAFGRRGAVYITDPIQTDGNRLKTALLKHFVKQFHEASCSVATVVTCLNAIRATQGSQAPPISQMEILEKVKTGNWKKRMSAAGDNGRRGLPLPLLGKVVEGSLDAYGIKAKAVEIVQVRKQSASSARIKADLLQRLHDFEKKGDCLIIAHFNQGVYVRALNIPHISPVGGFDPQHMTVTVLDVDTSQEKPYRVAFDTFYKGLASDYGHIFRPFGYGSGGYVFVRLS
jgi:hypothetical protein